MRTIVNRCNQEGLPARGMECPHTELLILQILMSRGAFAGCGTAGSFSPVGKGPSLTDGEAGGSCPGETVAGEVHREKAGCAASVNETVIQSELHGGDWRRPRESSLSLTRHVNREAGGIPIQHFDLASLQELAGTAVK